MPHQSDAVVADAEYLDEYIELEGIKFLVDGPIRATSIAEFATGLKIGPATYSEREHAWWVVLNDFSGGFGHRQLEIREAGGTHYDNASGVDVRRPRHITLPAKRLIAGSDNDPSNISLFYAERAAVVSDRHDVAGRVYLGCGGSIYSLQADSNTAIRTSLTRRFEIPNTNRINKILEFVGSDNTRALYACGYSTGSFNNEYHRNSNGSDITDWVTAASLPSSGVAYLSDMIVYNRQLIAQTTSNRIISSADGVSWSIDATPAEDPIYIAGGFVKFIGVAMSPYGESAVYFIDEGRLYVLDFTLRTAWPIEDLGEGNFLVTGVIWNGAIFITDGINVWEYNPGTIGTVRHLGPFGKDGAPPSWVEGAWAITQFLPGTSHLFALCRSLVDTQGRLLVYTGTGWTWYGPAFSQMPYTGIIDRLPVNLSLTQPTRHIDVIATDDQNDKGNTTVHSWKLPTVGDIPYVRNPGDPGGTAQRTFFENGPLSFLTGWYDGGFADLEGALFRLELDGYHLNENETVRVEYRLNNDEVASFTDLGTFTMNQQKLWFDTAHLGIPWKTVQFRTTLNRATIVNIDSTATASEPIDASETVIDVSDESVFAVGDIIAIDDEWMRIKVKTGGTPDTITVVRGIEGTTAATHDNGSTIYDVGEMPSPAQVNADSSISDTFSHSPELKSLILVYDKKPDLRAAYTVRIDISRMMEKGEKIKGEDASAYRIWQTLRSLWNTKRLLRLRIPSVDEIVNVRIVDMPITLEDFQEAMGGRGFVDLQLLEPVT